MNKLKEYIQEKLIINKHSKSKLLVDIKDGTSFTQQEIDEIYDFVQSLKIKPRIITNQIFDSAHNLKFEKNVIFIHFYDEWKKIPPYKKAENIRDEEEQIITIRFEKSSYAVNKYYYNVLSNKHNWLYSGSPSVQSCEEAIMFIKNDLKEEILEKLIINKYSKSKQYEQTEDVLILDTAWNYGGLINSFDINLLVTGLENLRDDNSPKPKDIMIFTEGSNNTNEYYIFHEDNKLIFNQLTSKKYKTCDLIIFSVKNETPNKDMLDIFIDHLNNYRLIAKYIRFHFDDNNKVDFRYLYVWYSKSLGMINMYFSNTDYKTLQEQNKFI